MPTQARTSEVKAMQAIGDRDYVRQHPGEVIKTFGLMAYIRAVGPSRVGLLEQMERKYVEAGIPMPGAVGNAYRLSALLELRAARIYARMVKRFEEVQVVREFFETLQAEEEEHARVMTLCLYTIEGKAEVNYVPSVRDPEVRALLRHLRTQERNVWRLSLDEALNLTEEMEASEVNVIFDKLLKQAQSPKTEFFISQLAKAEGHASAVPKRITALRQKLEHLRR
jgi:rubrerythrin